TSQHPPRVNPCPPEPSPAPAASCTSRSTASRAASACVIACPVCGTTVFHTEEGYEDRSVAIAISASADLNFPSRRMWFTSTTYASHVETCVGPGLRRDDGKSG